MSSFWAIGSPVFWKNSEKNARLCMEMKHWDGIMLSSENQKRCMAANRTKNKQTITSLLFWNQRAFICIKIELDRIFCIIIMILYLLWIVRIQTSDWALGGLICLRRRRRLLLLTALCTRCENACMTTGFCMHSTMQATSRSVWWRTALGSVHSVS